MAVKFDDWFILVIGVKQCSMQAKFGQSISAALELGVLPA